MTMRLPPEFEDFVQQGISAGLFRNPDQAFRQALELLKSQQRPADDASRDQRATTEEHLTLPKELDIDAVAEAQGVGVCKNADSLMGDFVPEDDDFDQWQAELRAMRQNDRPRELPL